MSILRVANHLQTCWNTKFVFLFERINQLYLLSCGVLNIAKLQNKQQFTTLNAHDQAYDQTTITNN